MWEVGALTTRYRCRRRAPDGARNSVPDLASDLVPRGGGNPFFLTRPIPSPSVTGSEIIDHPTGDYGPVLDSKKATKRVLLNLEWDIRRSK